jgi:hypothetical protein
VAVTSSEKGSGIEQLRAEAMLAAGLA